VHKNLDCRELSDENGSFSFLPKEKEFRKYMLPHPSVFSTQVSLSLSIFCNFVSGSASKYAQLKKMEWPLFNKPPMRN